jgi:predicted TIM-barrel fold metal-dependent hydrolase
LIVTGKIALEEHFATAALEGCILTGNWDPDAWRALVDRLEDVDGARLERMDALGIDIAVLSLGSEGIQGIADTAGAIATAREANDALAEIVVRHPDRFAGFAALPMQDPHAATTELERAVHELGFVGALVNGYSNTAAAGEGTYYDGPDYLPFWETVAALDVPVYLHPRDPLPGSRAMFGGRPELLGPTWAFAVETGTHALRLVTSGLFDKVPGLTVILGHLGEFLPFAIARLEQRIAHYPVDLERSPTEVLQQNFYITTSGNCHTPSLIGALLQLGADRVMFATDYPFEDMSDGATWFDMLPISESDRLKIGRRNAERLLRLSTPRVQAAGLSSASRA